MSHTFLHQSESFSSFGTALMLTRFMSRVHLNNMSVKVQALKLYVLSDIPEVAKAFEPNIFSWWYIHSNFTCLRNMLIFPTSHLFYEFYAFPELSHSLASLLNCVPSRRHCEEAVKLHARHTIYTTFYVLTRTSHVQVESSNSIPKSERPKTVVEAQWKH